MRKNSKIYEQYQLQSQVYGNVNYNKNIINSNKQNLNKMNSISHYRNLKQLSTIIDSYQKKLDDRVNQMFHHIINYSKNINDVVLPKIENKKISNQATSSSIMADRRARAQSIGSRSFVINNDMSLIQEPTQADQLFNTFKNINEKPQSAKKNQHSNNSLLGVRNIGAQTYAKPKIYRKKPQILSKQMRWDPFYQKNAIKAQQLNQGMLSLIQKGRIGKNIDIITAFQKGRPVLQTHQAIFHHLQQRFADTDFQHSQIKQSNSSVKKHIPKNPQTSSHQVPRNLNSNDDGGVQYNNANTNSWALTMVDDPNYRTMENKQMMRSSSKLINQDISLHYIKFLHYKLVRDDSFKTMKQIYKFNQYWGQIQEIIYAVEKVLKKFNIQIIYCNGNKILQYAKKRQSLTKVKATEIQQFLTTINDPKSKQKIKPFSIKSIVQKQSKLVQAVYLLISAFKSNLTRNRYKYILKIKKYEKRVQQWTLSGLAIKNYRKQLKKVKQQTLKKFQQQQRNFRANFATIQQQKHYQIHIANRQYMNGFKHFQQFCNTQITRIFNLQNKDTNIIYVSPFQLNVQTINYYFKIMELQDIDNYNERITFLQLQDITSQVKLPQSLTTSQKLYFSSKALRKLKRKTQANPSYFVINYPTQIDINLSVFMGIPIYSGDFNQINPLRSALNSQRLLCQGIETTPGLCIQPKQYHNIFQLSNVIMRHCQSNKKQYRKYIIKLNNRHQSAGLALLTYPFNSLPQLYTNTVLIQHYYFKSIQKYYLQLLKSGGVIQKYEQGIRTIAVCAKIEHDGDHIINGTFQKISNGFVNIGYIFPQKYIAHKVLVQKCKQVLDKLGTLGHIGYVQLTLVVNLQQQLWLEQIQLYSTKITNSLYYFKFLAGGYFNHLGQFMTKITGDQPQIEDEEIVSMQPRSYCYIPFILHYGLSEKQTSSFFQLCRIGGVSFDLQNKFGTTFIILGSLKDTIGMITTAKDRKNVLKLISKSTQFLIKQNSHNMSTEMLKEKQIRLKERLNINGIKDRIQQL